MESPGYDYIKLHAAYSQSSYIFACPPNISVPCSGQVSRCSFSVCDVVLDVIHLPQGLCHIDGTCACDDGLRGRDCTIVCNGGRKNPCTGHGDQGLAS